MTRDLVVSLSLSLLGGNQALSALQLAVIVRKEQTSVAGCSESGFRVPSHWQDWHVTSLRPESRPCRESLETPPAPGYGMATARDSFSMPTAHMATVLRPRKWANSQGRGGGNCDGKQVTCPVPGQCPPGPGSRARWTTAQIGP